MPVEARRLFEPVQVTDKGLEEHIQKEIDKLAAHPIRLVDSVNGCPLTAMGDYLVHLVDLTSRLADGLVHGEYVRRYLKDKVPGAANEPDWDSADDLHQRHTALKNLVSKINCRTQACKQVWETSPNHSFIGQRLPGTDNEQAGHAPSVPLSPSLSPLQSRHPPSYQDVDSPPTRESSVEGQSITNSEFGAVNMDYRDHVSPYPNEDIDLLERLSIRGTGYYQCEHGYGCRKGGVNTDGSLKVFIRNSDFKTHMMKHRKDYKCDLPNCPNKGKGFARPDQLERHKATVKHEQALFLPQTPRR